MSRESREVGDIFARYEKISAEQDDKHASDWSNSKFGPLKFGQIGDSVFDALNRVAGHDPNSIEHSRGNLRVNIELAAAKAIRSPSRKRYGKLTIEEGAEICESPIERSLLPWLCYANCGDCFEAFPLPIYDFKNDFFPALADIFIVPQFAFVKYRADFAIIAKHKSSTLITAIECDGKQFHSARKDVLRDGVFASFGVRTFRAEGSQIRNDPWSFAHSIGQYINDWALQL